MWLHMLNVASKTPYIIRDLMYNMLAHFKLTLTEEGKGYSKMGVLGGFLLYK